MRTVFLHTGTRNWMRKITAKVVVPFPSFTWKEARQEPRALSSEDPSLSLQAYLAIFFQGTERDVSCYLP